MHTASEIRNEGISLLSQQVVDGSSPVPSLRKDIGRFLDEDCAELPPWNRIRLEEQIVLGALQHMVGGQALELVTHAQWKRPTEADPETAYMQRTAGLYTDAAHLVAEQVTRPSDRHHGIREYLLEIRERKNDPVHAEAARRQGTTLGTPRPFVDIMALPFINNFKPEAPGSVLGLWVCSAIRFARESGGTLPSPKEIAKRGVYDIPRLLAASMAITAVFQDIRLGPEAARARAQYTREHGAPPPVPEGGWHDKILPTTHSVLICPGGPTLHRSFQDGQPLRDGLCHGRVNLRPADSYKGRAKRYFGRRGVPLDRGGRYSTNTLALTHGLDVMTRTIFADPESRELLQQDVAKIMEGNAGHILQYA